MFQKSGDWDKQSVEFRDKNDGKSRENSSVEDDGRGAETAG